MNISFDKIDKLVEVVWSANSVLENEELELLNFQLLGETSKQARKTIAERFIKSTIMQAKIPYFYLATREPITNIESNFCINMFIEQTELIIGKRMEAEEAIGVIKAFSIPSVADIEKELFSNCNSMHDIETSCNIYKKRLLGKMDSNAITYFRTRAKNGFPGFDILHERGLIKENDLSNIKHCFYYIAINAADLCESVVNLLNLYSPTQDQQDAQPQQTSNIYLSNKKGMKIDYIRVINCLYELGFFVDEKQNTVNKIDVMKAFGFITNKDLKNYDKDLSRALSDSTALTKHLEIFDILKEKMTEIFNIK